MKKVAIFDTSIGSFNQGDSIIMESCYKELKEIYHQEFLVKFSTHTPLRKEYQIGKNTKKAFSQFDYKFICGTNILNNNMLVRTPLWNINLVDSIYLKNCILVGVGMGNEKIKINKYTKKLYRKVLSKNYYHSTRDEKTKEFLESIGLSAINTGCPTLWSLNNDFCEKIPKYKSKTVVITLTDYAADICKDQKFIDIINNNYEKIYFWIQGIKDLEYLRQLKNTNNFVLISPNVDDYNCFLKETECDYIGTRLHAGIKAMQHARRSIILIVDNRARDMKNTYGIKTIDRNKIEELPKFINDNYKTNLKVDTNKILEWKNQFIF